MKSGYLSDKDYNFIYSNVPRICVDIIIEGIPGEILLLKRDAQPYKGKWHLPGGRIKFRESVHKAIKRIAKNELGIKVKIGSFIGFMEFPLETQNGNKRHSISLAFNCLPLNVLKNGCYKNIHKEKNMHPVHFKFLRQYYK